MMPPHMAAQASGGVLMIQGWGEASTRKARC